MPPRKHARRRKKSKKMIRLAVLLLILLLMIGLIGGCTAAVVNLIRRSAGSGSSGGGKTTTTTGPREPQVVATATVGNSGDILIHTPVLRSAKVSGGVYDFAPMFQYMTPYASKADYAVINTEFGIGTGESDYYQPEMLFRVPSTLIDALKNTGYDLGLCANNHITNGSSLSLTANTLREKGMEYTGMRMSGDKRYLVKEISGITLGFINYTYGAATTETSPVNYFSAAQLDSFYTDLDKQMTAMKNEGAEAIVVYLHWGYEYSLTPADYQTAMAQKLCEMGVDVIVGGHPHKIQPLKLITAENGNQTACLYSMGNFLSNQTIESMYGGSYAANRNAGRKNFQDGGLCGLPDVLSRYSDTNWDKHEINCNDNGHTEDGLLFSYTFSKYEDGKVLLTGVEVLPTWCYRGKKADGNASYTVIPLDKSLPDWQTAFQIPSQDLPYAERSYNRTMALVGNGMTAINEACNAKVAAYVESFKQAQLPTATVSAP